MRDPAWRPARFFAGILIAGDPVFTYTVEPGELAIVTAIMGSYVGDGSTTQALQVTAAGVPIYDVDATSAFVAPIQPSLPLYALVAAGDFITVSMGPGPGPAQAAITVSGICYGADAFPGDPG